MNRMGGREFIVKLQTESHTYNLLFYEKIPSQSV